MPFAVHVSKRLMSSRLPALALGLAISGFSGGIALANEIQNDYSLAVGATSAPIAVPGTNTPVQMICASNTPNYRGVSQATILRPYPNQFLEWVGVDIATTSITHGYSGRLGDHVIYCSFTDKFVEIQIYSDASIQVKNNGSVPVTGVITWIW